mgnify:CR=1 FL=1
MPYIFVVAEEDQPKVTESVRDDGTVRITQRAKKGDENDKKAAVYELYKQLVGSMNNNQLAKHIAAQLDLTVPNVGYYITRVFPKMK